MVGPRLPRCSLNYNIPRRVPAMVERDVAGKRIGVVISANGRRRLLFTTNAISFEWNALDTRHRPLSRRGLVVHHARPKSNDAVASWCEPRRGRGEERGGVRVPRVYRRQNAEGLVNGAKYTTVVHNEGTALSVPISSRASFFTRRFRVVPVALWGFKRAL